jgi:AcrR family transcriptional regulator
MTPQAVAARLRRMDAARHGEILTAALAELQEVGYDRMTMDAVARRAGASKATLYRHWPSKADLVVDAIRLLGDAPDETSTDTGTLRGDLLALLLGTHGPGAEEQLCVIRGMVSACATDPEMARAFQSQIISHKRDLALAIVRRAQLRGEVSEATDIQFLVDVVPGMLVFRHLLTPHPVDEAYLTRLVDEVWLPLLTSDSPHTAS